MLIHQKEMGIEMFNIRLAWYGKMRDERKEGNKKIVTTDKLELFFFTPLTPLEKTRRDNPINIIENKQKWLEWVTRAV